MKNGIRCAILLLSLTAIGCSSTADKTPDTTTPTMDQPADLIQDMNADISDASTDTGTTDQGQDSGEDMPDSSSMDMSIDVSEDMPIANTDGLCANVTERGGRPRQPGTNPGKASPFGTGASNDVILGEIEDPNGPPSAVSRGVNLAQDLKTRTYDVYVPDDYDGSKPYGLVVFINSGNNGSQPNGNYLPQFKSDRLIQVAPNDAGNSINVDVRMGLALLGAVRAMELFNIDPSRVYAMGNSGGARSAHMLSYQYPELFSGAMPRCGANYPRAVDQDYETREPDGNYEFWGGFYFPSVNGMPYLDHLRSRNMRFALMTSFRDFREGDVFNIYHNGMERDNLNARLIQRSGGHCATGAAHFADAMGWIEHPLHDVVQDTFDATTRSEKWYAINGDAVPKDGSLELTAPAQDRADLLLGDRVRWNDRHGIVLRTTLDMRDAPMGKSRVALWPFDAARHVKGSFQPPTSMAEAQNGVISVSIERNGATAQVVVEVARKGEPPIEAFRATFDDWNPSNDPIDLRIDAWDAELQIDLGWHLKDPTSVDGADLLNDRRTIRTRWETLLPNGWGLTEWSQGSVMTLSMENATNNDTLRIDDISLQDGAGFTCTP